MAALYLLLSLLTKASIFLSFSHKIPPKYTFKIMGQFCFLVAICSVFGFYKRVFQGFMGFFVMIYGSILNVFFIKYNDFGCGFLFLGCFVEVSDFFVFFFMFILGFKVLEFDRVLKFSCFEVKNSVETNGNVNLISGYEKECDFIEGENEKDDGSSDVDKVFDVMYLRKMVKFERVRADVACNEVDKERNASSSAAAEAMAMILRLQSEKSSAQMQIKQFERLAEEKQLYDHDVIESLEWIVMKHEYERCLLEDQLRVCREKLKCYMNDEEWDQFEGVNPTLSGHSSSLYDGNKFEDVHVSSLNLEVSPM